MTPRTISDDILRDAPLLHADDVIADATPILLESGLPALAVVDREDRFAGIFGEREFMTAAFPGYLKELKFAGFVSRTLDDALERNEACRQDPVSRHMNTEHVDVGPDYSDLQIAETFIHHRVLIVPVVDNGTVKGIITRSDFFAIVARRLLG
ncbi:MAG TPA: CBS domain-containing protein [Thermoleophilaceae bacterium]|nr:CBS domain-containing protein [Thermoleophilaceae bacterium]